MLHGEQRKMCPKHGVAHGVCVEPIKAEIPPEPPKLPLHLEPCDIPNCTWCGADTSVAAEHRVIGELVAAQDRLMAPNRFDPYEALGRCLRRRRRKGLRSGGSRCRASSG